MDAADLLSTIIRINVIGAAAIVAVLMLRAPLRAAFGAPIVYRLWLIVPLSMIAALAPARTVLQIVQAELSTQSTQSAMSISEQVSASVALAPAAAEFDLAVWGIAGWICGALAWAAILMMSQVAFERSLGRKTPDGKLVRTSKTGFGPVVLGVLRPRIVLPSDFESRFSADEQRLVLEHEWTHCRTGDQFVNLGAAVLRCLCWFNPFVHLGAHYLRLDQELACDAAVVARQPEIRRVYAEAMLKAQLSTSLAPVACHWPTRSSALLKQRIIALQSDKPGRIRRAAGASFVAVAFAAGSAVAWASQPARVITQYDPGVAALRAALAYDLPARQARIEPARFNQQENTARASDEHAEVNRVSAGDGTPLIRAARAGDLTRTQQLLSQGAEVNKAGHGDGNPLIAAARFGGLEMVRLLVEAGADVNAYVPGDETPLINASAHGDLSVIGYLIDHGADPSLAVPSTNFPGEMRTPLSMAANPRVADYLKTRGAGR